MFEKVSKQKIGSGFFKICMSTCFNVWKSWDSI